MSAGALADWIAPHRTALLVIDVQADFGAPGGAVGRSGADMSAVPAALAGAERLAEAARAAGAPVIFVTLQTAPEQDSRAWAERLRRMGGEPALELDLCRVGSPGADLIGPRPIAGELVVPKLRYSGFFRTTLDAELQQRGVDTLVACGLTTDCCVDSTVRDAFHLDYQVFIAHDACAAYDPQLHAAALQSLGQTCAILASVDEIVAAWCEAPGQA